MSLHLIYFNGIFAFMYIYLNFSFIKPFKSPTEEIHLQRNPNRILNLIHPLSVMSLNPLFYHKKILCIQKVNCVNSFNAQQKEKKIRCLWPGTIIQFKGGSERVASSIPCSPNRIAPPLLYLETNEFIARKQSA